jgi:hypothetical protein
MAKNDAAAGEYVRLLMVLEAATVIMIMIQCRYQAVERVATSFDKISFDRFCVVPSTTIGYCCYCCRQVGGSR